MSPVLAQILGKWDQDPVSTIAHLMGLQRALAYTLGAVNAELHHNLSNDDIPAMDLEEALLRGRATRLVHAFRCPECKEEGPHITVPKEHHDNVVALPVVHRTPKPTL